MRLLRARLQTLLGAGAEATIMASLFTHNPLCHLVPLFSPFFLISAPVLGGMAARGRTRFGFGGALFVALFTSMINTAPHMLVLPFLYIFYDKFDSPAQAAAIVNVAQVILAVWFCYHVLGVLIGIGLRSLWPNLSTPYRFVFTERHTVNTHPDRAVAASDTRIAVGTELGPLLAHEVDVRTFKPNLN